MMIAIPIREGKFSSHFGGAEAFALYTVDEASREVSEQNLAAPPEHGRGVFPASDVEVRLRLDGQYVGVGGAVCP